MFFGNLIEFFSLVLTFFQDLGLFFLDNLSSTFGVIFAIGVSLYIAGLIFKYSF